MTSTQGSYQKLVQIFGYKLPSVRLLQIYNDIIMALKNESSFCRYSFGMCSISISRDLRLKRCIYINIYIQSFSRRFYPKRLTYVLRTMYTHFTFTLMAHCTSGAIGATVVQEVDKSVSNQKVASSIPCRSVLEQDTEPLIAPDVQCAISVKCRTYVSRFG